MKKRKGARFATVALSVVPAHQKNTTNEKNLPSPMTEAIATFFAANFAGSS
jgi:hypothetical protein